MGRPVVHFEVIGADDETLRRFYAELFEWEIDADNPMRYGIVSREGNVNEDGVGIGGGVGWGGPEATGGHAMFYVEVPDVEEALAQAERLGGTRVMGPEGVPGGGPVLGHFKDPEGNAIGLVGSAGD
jgi:predicted enzyme related to lactoylglutathione lyase